MGMNEVINQVVVVLGTVEGLTQVFDHAPLLITPEAFPYAWVMTAELSEYRHGIGGAVNQGRKRADHRVHITVHDVSFEPATGERAFRTLLDAIRAKLRANQSLAGVSVRFAEDIEVRVATPRASEGQAVQYQAEVSATAIEEFQA